jgi:3-oxoacyl-[acyl-carrier-protein] synthase-3
MPKIKAAIIGVGAALPEKIVTNKDLTKIVDTSDEWIVSRTGIRERRVSDDKTSTGDLALNAAEKALKHANIKPEEIDLIIVGTTSPDMLFPSTACILQDKLNAPQAAGFDLSAACSGFIYALSAASKYIETETYKTVLVVGADTLSKYVNWEDRDTCVLFGDGAGAVVLTASTSGNGILNSLLGAEGGGGKYLTMPGGGSRHKLTPEFILKKGHCISMEGKEVFKFAVRVLESGVKKVIEEIGLKISDISLLIPHQANTRIIDHAIKRLGLEKEKVYVNLDRYGNTSAASVPIALHEAIAEGRLKDGDLLVITGFGAGLTYGAAAVRWGT